MALIIVALYLFQFVSWNARCFLIITFHYLWGGVSKRDARKFVFLFNQGRWNQEGPRVGWDRSSAGFGKNRSSPLFVSSAHLFKFYSCLIMCSSSNGTSNDLFNCHFVHLKRHRDKSCIYSNTPYQNILKCWWNDLFRWISKCLLN